MSNKDDYVHYGFLVATIPVILVVAFVSNCYGKDASREEMQELAVIHAGAASYDERSGQFQWAFNRPTVCYYGTQGNAGNGECTDAPAWRELHTDDKGEVTLVEPERGILFSDATCSSLGCEGGTVCIGNNCATFSKRD